MTDTERLDWLEDSKMDLVCNYRDEWKCVLDFHGDLDDDLTDAKPTVREAIDDAIRKQDEQNERGN